MFTQTYSHNLGEHAVTPQDLTLLNQFLNEYNIPISRNYTQLKQDLQHLLNQNGWSAKVHVDRSSTISIPSIKNKTGLSLQTGNIARFYSDVLKFQLMYEQNKIDSALYIVPFNKLALKINTNSTNFERVTKELELFKYIISMPICVIGFKEEN